MATFDSPGLGGAAGVAFASVGAAGVAFASVGAAGVVFNSVGACGDGVGSAATGAAGAAGVTGAAAIFSGATAVSYLGVFAGGAITAFSASATDLRAGGSAGDAASSRESLTLALFESPLIASDSGWGSFNRFTHLLSSTGGILT